jgi:hypothetical protein
LRFVTIDRYTDVTKPTSAGPPVRNTYKVGWFGFGQYPLFL